MTITNMIHPILPKVTVAIQKLLANLDWVSAAAKFPHSFALLVFIDLTIPIMPEKCEI